MIKRILPHSTIQTCSDGLKAINKLKLLNEDAASHFPDYIFLDLRIPVMNGWEFLKEFERLAVQDEIRSKLYVLSSTIDRDEIEDTINIMPNIPKMLIENAVDGFRWHS